jgi:hypothetical protein
MQTFTLSSGSWLRRLFVRNALLRASDRIEAFVMFAVLVSAILTVPIAGALGTSVYVDRLHAFTTERLMRHEVEATATRDSSVTGLPYRGANLTPLRWQYSDRTHIEIVGTPETMKAGEQTSIWVDETGARTEQPLSENDAATEAAMSALGLWIAVAGGGVAVCALLRSRLNQLRYVAWDRELDDLANSGGWTDRNG